MKKIILILLLIGLVFSCSKVEKNNGDVRLGTVKDYTTHTDGTSTVVIEPRRTRSGCKQTFEFKQGELILQHKVTVGGELYRCVNGSFVIRCY